MLLYESSFFYFFHERKCILKNAFLGTSFGVLTALENNGALHCLSFEKNVQILQKAWPSKKKWEYSRSLEKRMKAWLKKPKENHFTLALYGTDFQISVWRALLRIPFGSSISYSDLAQSIGREKAHRALGTAVGKNPIAILVPCHRVILASGHIGNYYWGEEKKRAILAWEQQNL